MKKIAVVLFVAIMLSACGDPLQSVLDRSVWSADTIYMAWDECFVSDVLYVCIQSNNLGNWPPDSPDWWMLSAHQPGEDIFKR